jgi:uncharacterized protein YPO0396
VSQFGHSGLTKSAKLKPVIARSDNGDIHDVPHYLNRLRVLKEEALPEKRSRFLEYLNRSSDHGVTQLLAGIDEEVDAIEQRIKELNQTLVKVDFRQGRFARMNRHVVRGSGEGSFIVSCLL